MNEMKDVMPRVLRDMDEGIIVLDNTGTIIFFNERGQQLLEKDPSCIGQKFVVSFFDDNEDGNNDKFNQFILDAVYDKEHSHSGSAPFYSEDGECKIFQLTSSFLKNEVGKENIGVVVVFSDITEIENLNQQRRESSVIFAVLMICVCGYLFFYSFLKYINIELEPWVMSKIIEAISILMFIIILKKTSFSLKDIGLKITDYKATFMPNIIITVVATAALVILKLIILKVAPSFFPEGAPFWDWSVISISDFVYPFTVILQEFLARGVMQENLMRIFTGKHRGALSIIVSSLVFGALHIAYGLPLMLGASLLLGALGILYYKQGTMWGLCIVHFFLGEVASFLRYLY